MSNPYIMNMSWRLELDVGRAGELQHHITPLYTVKFETSKGTRVVEMDFDTLSRLKAEVETSIASMRAVGKLNE